ncbi:MAG: hypothetical protein IT302_14705 [Dehalococcoidia bacterium]|nr:hypothetical protein [Dehalococcoidia bacterium]
MNFPPFAVARYGVYLALFAAVMSAWLGQRAGASLDYALLRSVFVFVIFTALGFGAEAVLTVGVHPIEHPAQAAKSDHGGESDE